MLRRISQIYDVAFSENRGKALIASVAGSMIPATSGLGAASMLKAVPIFGTIAGGFVMPALSAGATYAIGKAFIQHFATGGNSSRFQSSGLPRVHQKAAGHVGFPKEPKQIRIRSDDQSLSRARPQRVIGS